MSTLAIILLAAYIVVAIFWFIVFKSFGHPTGQAVWQALVWPVVFPIYIKEWIDHAKKK